MPVDLSWQLYEKEKAGEDACYTWDWGESRKGSWKLDGEDTSINRYILDFNAMEQRNIDNDRRRTIRCIWVHPDEVNPAWTGEIPES